MLGPVVESIVGGRLPVQTFLPWASIVPIADVRSSYNGLLILLFLAISGRRCDVHPSLCDARNAAERHLGLRLSRPIRLLRNTPASSFAMPIRRVFGTTMFLVRETVDMPRPGEMRAAHFRVRILDPAWRYLYGPVARAVMRAAVTLNQLQFLTIRSYLTLGFRDAGLLLLVVAAWR